MGRAQAVRYASRIAAVLVASTSFSTLHAQAGPSDQPDTTPVWRLTTSSDITAIILDSVDTPVLFVLTKQGLLCLDPATGAQRWAREDLRHVPPANLILIPSSARALALGEAGMEILDLHTGQRVSGSSSWSVSEVYGFLTIGRLDLALLVAKTSASNHTLLGVDVRTGQVKWRQDGVFAKGPELLQVFSGRRRGMYNFSTSTLHGSQIPVMDTDTTLIIYLSKDGPVKIHVATGAVLWRAVALKGNDVPLWAGGYAFSVTTPDILYVPVENSLSALAANDGRAMWGPGQALPGRIRQMELTSSGLLVRGAKPNRDGYLIDHRFVDLIDPRTGKSVWAGGAREVEHTAPFVTRGDTAYLATKNQLVAMSLADGSARVLASFKFEGGQAPVDVELRDNGILLLASHNMLLVDHDGATVYHRSFKPPGTGFFEAALGRFLDKPLKGTMTGIAEHFVYVVTKAVNPSGREGLSLVRVDKRDGSEAGRIWLGGKPGDYEVEPVTDMVYLQRADREVVAMRFAMGTPTKP